MLETRKHGPDPKPAEQKYRRVCVSIPPETYAAMEAQGHIQKEPNGKRKGISEFISEAISKALRRS